VVRNARDPKGLRQVKYGIGIVGVRLDAGFDPQDGFRNAALFFEKTAQVAPRFGKALVAVEGFSLDGPGLHAENIREIEECSLFANPAVTVHAGRVAS
jgi:hypothetical protein